MLSDVNTQEMRATLSLSDALMGEESEAVISRHGQAIAEIFPIPVHRKFPDYTDLRLPIG